jgi:hypothetical protein
LQVLKQSFPDIHNDFISEPCAQPEAGDLYPCEEDLRGDEGSQEGVKDGQISMGYENVVH